MGDGDGWVTCARGHRHWGRHGAAGIYITDGARSILQHRAPWTHEGGAWGLPGGARDSHEDVVSAALREVNEEAGVDANSVLPLGLLVEDHGGWSYTSVVASARNQIVPYAANAESSEVRWWPVREIGGLGLHRGLAGMWPRLQAVPGRLTLVVDTANVPTGNIDLWHRLRILARCGVRVSALPDGCDAGGLDVLLPRIIVLAAQPASYAVEADGPPEWWHRALTVARRAPELGANVVAVGTGNARGAIQVGLDWLLSLGSRDH